MDYLKKLLKVFLLLVTFLILASLSNGCDPFSVIITFDNQTQYSVQVMIKPVSLDYAGTPILKWKETDVVIKTGQSQKFVTSVPDDEESGLRNKYIAVAVADTGKVVFSKLYTWDELHDADWKVVIEENIEN